MNEALAAARSLLNGPRLALITSLRRADAPADSIEMVAVSPDAAWRIATPLIGSRFAPNGTGDAVAALFSAHWIESGDVALALGKAASSIFAVLEATRAQGERELQLVAAQDRMVAPSRHFTAESYSHAMNVPGFVFNPIALAIEGAAIGFVIAVPVGPAAALCIAGRSPWRDGGLHDRHRRGAGRCRVRRGGGLRPLLRRQFVFEREAWLLGIGGIVLVIMGWTTMRHRPRSVGDPVADDREHRVATHLHYASSSFFITVFNPVTVMAFGAAFASRNLAGVGASLPDAALLVAPCSAARSPGGRSSARRRCRCARASPAPACCG